MPSTKRQQLTFRKQEQTYYQRCKCSLRMWYSLCQVIIMHCHYSLFILKMYLKYSYPAIGSVTSQGKCLPLCLRNKKWQAMFLSYSYSPSVINQSYFFTEPHSNDTRGITRQYNTPRHLKLARTNIWRAVVDPRWWRKQKLAYNAWTTIGRPLIFHMCIPFDKTFPWISKFLTKWPWPWCLTYFLKKI